MKKNEFRSTSRGGAFSGSDENLQNAEGECESVRQGEFEHFRRRFYINNGTFRFWKIHSAEYYRLFGCAYEWRSFHCG